MKLTKLAILILGLFVIVGCSYSTSKEEDKSEEIEGGEMRDNSGGFIF